MKTVIDGELPGASDDVFIRPERGSTLKGHDKTRGSTRPRHTPLYRCVRAERITRVVGRLSYLRLLPQRNMADSVCLPVKK